MNDRLKWDMEDTDIEDDVNETIYNKIELGS
jgi:hypothetical protein